MESTKAILTALISLHLLASAAAATDPLLLDVHPVQSSDGLTHFVATAPTGSKSFNLSLDTSSSGISLRRSECSAPGELAFTFSTVRQNDFFPGGLEVANLSVVCTDKSILGLGSGPSSMASQLWSRTAIRKTFAYCLSSSAAGQLAFGRTFYHVFRDTDILQARTATLVRIPVNGQSTGSYQLELTRVGVGRSGFLFKLLDDTAIQVGTTSRYTSLPAPAYQALRTRIESIAAAKRIAKLPTSFGELDLCYRMNSSQLNSFPNMTMEFSSNAVWTVSPANYLVRKPVRGEAVCLAIKPASAPSSAVIGTFQQEDNWVEYDQLPDPQ